MARYRATTPGGGAKLHRHLADPPPAADSLLTVPEVGALVGLSESSVRVAILDGALPVAVSEPQRCRPADVQAWLKQRQANRQPKRCVQCGEEFKPRSVTHTYCSNRCRADAYNYVPRPQEERPQPDDLLTLPQAERLFPRGHPTLRQCVAKGWLSVISTRPARVRRADVADVAARRHALVAAADRLHLTTAAAPSNGTVLTLDAAAEECAVPLPVLRTWLERGEVRLVSNRPARVRQSEVAKRVAAWWHLINPQSRKAAGSIWPCGPCYEPDTGVRYCNKGCALVVEQLTLMQARPPLCVLPDLPPDITPDNSLALFRAEISNGPPLLQPQEEVDLALARDAGIEAQRRLRMPDTSAALRPVLEQVRQAGAAAVQRLLESNLRLVINLAARQWQRHIGDMPLPDLVSEGTLGLSRAVTKWSPHRGLRFSTYATSSIQQMLQRSARDQGLTIRIPQHLHERATTIYRAEIRLHTDLDREPTDAEVAAAVGCTVEQVKDTRAAIKPTMSLDMPLGEAGEVTMADLLEDKDAADPSEVSAAADLGTRVADALGCLTPRERLVIEQRFGLNDVGPCVLQEVGDRLGISRERVRQIQDEALAKLRVNGRLEQLATVVDI